MAKRGDLVLSKCLGVAVCYLVMPTGFALCQAPPDLRQREATLIRITDARKGPFVLHVEPLALGVRYTWSVGPRWGIGPQLVVGPFQGISLGSTDDVDDLKEWASAYVSVTRGIGSRMKLVVAPLGATAVAGNDFGAIYPTGQLGVDYRVDRVLIGSDLRVIRIAGSNGSGNYWLQWIPVRIGMAFGSEPPN